MSEIRFRHSNYHYLSVGQTRLSLLVTWSCWFLQQNGPKIQPIGAVAQLVARGMFHRQSSQARSICSNKLRRDSRSQGYPIETGQPQPIFPFFWTYVPEQQYHSTPIPLNRWRRTSNMSEVARAPFNKRRWNSDFEQINVWDGNQSTTLIDSRPLCRSWSWWPSWMQSSSIYVEEFQKGGKAHVH